MKKQLPNSLLKIGLGLSFAIMSWNANFYAQTWENVGLTAGVSSGDSSYNNLVIDNDGNYYISYYDVSVAKGSVQKFNGTDWSYVGGSAGITTDIATFNSLSINSTGQLYYTNQISWPGAGMEVRYFKWNCVVLIDKSC